MPEVLAPGVYVQEVSFRSKSIEGVGTSTTGFVGRTRKGPSGETPEIITSFGDFERIYGSIADVGGEANHLALAADAYFRNGGARLYVSRVIGAGGSTSTAEIIVGATGADAANFVSRFQGAAGNGTISVTEMEALATVRTMNTAPDGTMLVTRDTGGAETFRVKTAGAWLDSGGAPLDLTGMTEDDPPDAEAGFLTMNVVATDADGYELTYEELGYAPAHPRWIGDVLSQTPSRRGDHLQNMFAITIGGNVTPFLLREGMFAPAPVSTTDDQGRPLRELTLQNGSDGGVPNAAAFEAALGEFEKLDDIAIVGAPGYTANPNSRAIQSEIIIHVSRQRAYRVAVLEVGEASTPGEARQARARVDSKYAAMYYPWVLIPDERVTDVVSSTPREMAVPPTGFICGIYARNDIQRGVHKAPANEVVRGALRFEREITHGEQEMLNPIGVNCLRYFPGRGYRVWGARTVSSDPEWKYVNVRRYFNYLEHSIDRGTQWAVFEPNGPRLWANIRETVGSFLFTEWKGGALLGTSPEEAYFVRCDRSTMTQNDLDNGRLICEIGVAPLKPAEFVIFRIGQKTADARS